MDKKEPPKTPGATAAGLASGTLGEPELHPVRWAGLTHLTFCVIQIGHSGSPSLPQGNHKADKNVASSLKGRS